MINRNCYKIKAKYTQTQRKRTVTIYARTPEQAIEICRSKGFEDPFEVDLAPLPAPSDRQLDYAKDLGASVTPDMCADDVSCLISRYVDDRTPPKQGLMDFADGRDVIFSDWIGKKRLYRAIFDQLPKIDRYAFFCFSIYRYLSEDRESNMDKSANRDFFYHFANLYILDEKFEESLMNNYDGADLRFFGTLTTVNNGWERSHTGGSTRTYAYKKAHEFLVGSGLVNADTRASKTLYDTRANQVEQAQSAPLATPAAPVVSESPVLNTSPIDIPGGSSNAKGCGTTAAMLIVFTIFLALFLYS